MGALPRMSTRGLMARPIYRGFRGDKLREIREQRGCTQKRLAALVGAFPTMVGKWERGEVTPLARYVAALARHLGVPPQWFTDVPPELGSVIDLRVWAGLTRAQAAEAAEVKDHRLLAIEQLTLRPSAAEAGRLAGVYDVDRALLTRCWERDRAAAFPALTASSGA